MAPVIRSLVSHPGFKVRVCSTGQHRELLAGAFAELGVKPDLDLRVMRRDQEPGETLARLLGLLDGVVASERPGLVLVQGDTTSALAGALAAFHRKVPVGHVEAGLRTFDHSQPFPEEINRVLTDRVAVLHFAPTPAAVKNLLAEGVDRRRVFMTGNTVVDSLKWALARGGGFQDAALRRLPKDGRLVVVTLHRHESFGPPMEAACRGILKACESLPDLTWVYPEHPNPRARSARRFLRHPRIKVCGSLGYLDFVRLVRRAEFLVTDSGGAQEEAACLGKRVLVAREKTERPEIIPGWGVLVGSDPEKIAAGARAFAGGKRSPAPAAARMFGDGRAAEKIREAILRWRHER
ncbi:MAG: UDP-N-acetylglucosamine 2-epimerase (non-hydrolyzing) [Elusimicrobia bacterium]|nr:UDP-N-acetylglucosamine 2-epimerase (non-hydrolyzing) [Elusimicrobiota bacterium]